MPALRARLEQSFHLRREEGAADVDHALADQVAVLVVVVIVVILDLVKVLIFFVIVNGVLLVLVPIPPVLVSVSVSVPVPVASLVAVVVPGNKATTVTVLDGAAINPKV